ERVRDSLRDGFGLSEAVEHGWRRAIRTVLASDGINFLAAAILFMLAIGNVRGFAFTLGLTTLIDLVVIVLFTHPMLQLMARTKFWGGGHPASGLDPRQLGAVYRGRAQFRATVPASEKQARKRGGSNKEAARRQTIAERKAAAESKEG
ncbi:MAG: protein translocase subunit SecD, partial [Microbacteriaceae bacterium]|nr:protein translocase subunit SecD [Microbacteriaceae bacterium]